MDDRIQNVGWPGWETVQLLSQSESETVYEIKRDVFGYTERAELKIISIPQSQYELDQMRAAGFDDTALASIFRARMQALVGEYSRLREMNGTANIVSVDDYFVVPHEDGIGWNITVKEEFLIPLLAAMEEIPTEEKVMKLARDICSGLVQIRKNRVVYGQFTPLNIFSTKNGDYKLGDYVTARPLHNGPFGNDLFIAPEAFHTQSFDDGTDLYSFGLTLYWLLNEQKLPFASKSAGAELSARDRRIAGEAIPAPLHGSEELQKIVLKSVAFNREDRYQNAEEMLRDLMNLGKNEDEDAAAVPPMAGVAAEEDFIFQNAEPSANLVAAAGALPLTTLTAAPQAPVPVPTEDLSVADLPPAEATGAPAEKPKKKKKGLIVLLSLLGLAAAAALCWFFLIPKPEYGPWSAWSTERPADEKGRKVERAMEFRYKKHTLVSTSDINNVVGSVDHEQMEPLYWGNWGEWQDSAVTATDLRQVETKQQYRIRSTETMSSEEENLAGWTLYNSSSETGWGNWHDWSTTEPYRAENREVVSKTQYKCHTKVYKNGKNTGTRYYYGDWMDSMEYGKSGSKLYSWTSGSDNYVEKVYYDTRTVYNYREMTDHTTYYYYRWGEWSDWSDNEPVPDPGFAGQGEYDYYDTETESRTLYRYRDKEDGLVYYYYDWTDWSDWGRDEIQADQDTQVESRTVYRYRDRVN